MDACSNLRLLPNFYLRSTEGVSEWKDSPRASEDEDERFPVPNRKTFRFLFFYQKFVRRRALGDVFQRKAVIGRVRIDAKWFVSGHEFLLVVTRITFDWRSDRRLETRNRSGEKNVAFPLTSRTGERCAAIASCFCSNSSFNEINRL